MAGCWHDTNQISIMPWKRSWVREERVCRWNSRFHKILKQMCFRALRNGGSGIDQHKRWVWCEAQAQSPTSSPGARSRTSPCSISTQRSPRFFTSILTPTKRSSVTNCATPRRIATTARHHSPFNSLRTTSASANGAFSTVLKDRYSETITTTERAVSSSAIGQTLKPESNPDFGISTIALKPSSPPFSHPTVFDHCNPTSTNSPLLPLNRSPLC